jgi:NAD(P)-dependent dehydrogenase (short-subunit alcohol dehydrogenase family)
MTRDSTPFFHSTAEEVARGIDLIGSRAIVTCAASGIGVETARTLAGVVPNPTDYQSGMVAEHAADPESAERLWDESVRLLA